MINLLSPEQQRDIRAARVNITLLQYCAMFVVLGVVIGLVYGLGFWLVGQDKAAVNDKLLSQSEQSEAYAEVEKEAESFRQNLSVAKNILSKETSYSSFLTTLAADIPSGTILTSLSVGEATPVDAKKGMTLDGRAISYAKVLELKNKLEQSALFENVSIVSATRPDDISGLSGLDAEYPYMASFSVRLSAQKPGGQNG